MHAGLLCVPKCAPEHNIACTHIHMLLFMRNDVFCVCVDVDIIWCALNSARTTPSTHTRGGWWHVSIVSNSLPQGYRATFMRTQPTQRRRYIARAMEKSTPPPLCAKHTQDSVNYVRVRIRKRHMFE